MARLRNKILNVNLGSKSRLVIKQIEAAISAIGLSTNYVMLEVGMEDWRSVTMRYIVLTPTSYDF